MVDVALDTAGAHIVVATSNDDRYPPENILKLYVICLRVADRTEILTSGRQLGCFLKK